MSEAAQTTATSEATGLAPTPPDPSKAVIEAPKPYEIPKPEQVNREVPYQNGTIPKGHGTFDKDEEEAPAVKEEEKVTKEDSPEKKAEEASKDSKPKTLDLKLPEGALMTEKQLADLKAYAESKGFNQEQAEALVERENSFLRGQQEQVELEKAGWAKMVVSDPEIGGDRYKDTLMDCKVVMDRFADAEFKEVLNKTGLGDFPGFVKMVARIGRAMRDDSLVKASKEVKPVKSLADIMYPDEEPKQ